MSLSVSQLVRSIKDAVERDIGAQIVEGEISNYTRNASGHIYFTLKDAGAQISCVFFRGSAMYCKVDLKSGMQVEVKGNVTVYEKGGQMQLNVRSVSEAGVGDLQARFLALKKKLELEGLFDTQRKRPLVAFPRRIGIITSATGAALQDMRHVFERRAPWIQIILIPVPVQGKGAEEEIARALYAMADPSVVGDELVDVIIVGRGGGSIEDLWNFNEELLVRAIANSTIPVISAVGHETDFTIADFVADLRAPTPTAAAELATPDATVLMQRLNHMGRSLQTRCHQAFDRAKLMIAQYERGILGSPYKILEPYYQDLDVLADELKEAQINSIQTRKQRLETMELRLQPARVHQAIAQSIEQLKHSNIQLRQVSQKRLLSAHNKLELLQSLLESHNPQRILAKGFAIATTSDGKLLRDPACAPAGSPISLRVEKGILDVEVKA